MSRQRLGDACLACAIAAMPLAGGIPYLVPTIRDGAWQALGLVVVWVAAAGLTAAAPRRAARRALSLRPWRTTVSIWAAFVVVAGGSLVAALAAGNEINSEVFRENLAWLPHWLWAGMDQSSNPLYPLRIWSTYAAGAGTFVLVGLACVAAKVPRRRARACLWGALAGSTAAGCIAIWQYATGIGLHPYWVRVNPHLTRAHATLEDPNALGAYVVLMIGAAVGLGRSSRPIPAILAWLSAGIGVCAVVTTVSRAAWLGLAIATGVALVSGLIRRRQTGRRATVALVVVLAGVGSTWLGARLLTSPLNTPPLPKDPLQAAWLTVDPRMPLSEIATGRDIWWRAAVAMVVDAPAAGIGLGRFPRLVRSYATNAPHAENAHSFPLQVAAESGLPALLLLAALVVVVAGSLGRRARAGDELAGGVCLGAGAFSLTCLTGHPLLVTSGQFGLGVVLSATLIATRSCGARTPLHGDVVWGWLRPAGAPRDIALRAGLLALLLGMTAQIASTSLHARNGTALQEPWGYSSGLFPPERDAGGQYRWTTHRATLLLPRAAAPADLVLRYAVPGAPRRPRGTRVDFLLDGVLITAGVHHSPEWRTVTLPVHTREPSSSRPILLRVIVDAALNPAEITRSDDSRDLGIMLRAPELIARHEPPGRPLR